MGKSRSVKSANSKSKKNSGTLNKSAFKDSNPRLLQIEKGRLMKEFVEKGYSRGDLVRKFKRSDSLVRELLILGSMSKDLEEKFLRKELSRNQVLMEERARRKKDQARGTAPVRDLQKQTRHNPAPMMAEAERKKKIARLAKLVVDWFHSLELAPYDQETFWGQVNSASYGGLSSLITREAPGPNESNPDEDPREVINRCRVESRQSQTMPNIINNNVTWLSRWIQRVIPDWPTMLEVIDKARGQVLKEARNARWF